MADSNRDTLYRNKHTSTSEKSRKALLIQGVRDEEQMLAALFPPEQWNVVVAPDNQTALEIATSDKFDLVVTSAMTKTAEDVLLLRRLRMARPHTRMIILTEKKVAGDVLDALRYHAFSFFSAPFDRDNFRTLLQHVLDEPEWDDGIELIQGTPDFVTLAVRCSHVTLDRLEQFTREALPLPKAENEEVTAAFREIVMNAMEHGGKFDPNQYVEVTYLKSKRQVMCHVKDPGTGFSLQEVLEDAKRWEAIDSASLSKVEVSDTVPRGLGILIAEKFVDELIYSEKGNDVVLIKYLPRTG